MVLFLTGCVGPWEITVKEDVRFPKGSTVYFDVEGTTGDSLGLGGRLMSRLAMSGYVLTGDRSKADFSFSYSHSGGLTDAYGISYVRGLTFYMLDRQDNLVLLASKPGNAKNVEMVISAFFSKLEDYQ
jgi:hypothetical protein